LEIWEDSPCDSRESSDTLASMCRQGYRLLDRGPIAEYPHWRALAEQGHWLYDTAHERVRVTLEPAAFRVWVPAEEPGR
jgi:hypothetical protein